MAVDTNWFRHRLADRQLSQRGLARLLGIDPAALSLTLRGKRMMRLTEAADIARLLGVPLEDVLTHAGVQRASHNAALMITGWLDHVGEVHLADDLGAVANPGGELPAGATVIQCRSTGGLLDYMDGWLLFAAPPLAGGSADQLGRLCLVKMRDGVTLLAQLRRGYSRGLWNLAGPAAIANDVAIDWAATVLLIKT